MEKILANTVYSDSTLKRWKKEDLIEHIRILEHNWASAEERLANSVKNSEKIFYEQNAEIERLGRRNGEKIIKIDDLEVKVMDLEKENAELQKQVEKLTEENARLDKNVKWFQEKIENGELVSEQAIKDTAKEICLLLINVPEDDRHYWRNAYNDRVNDIKSKIKERYGVEVK